MKKVESPWDFSCPPYDERTSCYVDAGSHHGLGKAQPIGSEKHSMKGAVPVGRSHQMEVDEVPRKKLKIELEQ